LHSPMESTFSTIRNFFTDGIFGNLVRVIFDRFFGGLFTTNINFSNIVDVKNLHFKDLQLDVNKINNKMFKNSAFKLFSGSLGSFSLKFPSFNALLTESVELCIDKLDLLLVMNDVDFTKAEEEVTNQMKSRKENTQELENPNIETQSPDQNFDVYKKIINRILLNIKAKVTNLCIRVICDKPYKDVRLPVAPCFMLKVGMIDLKRNLDQLVKGEATDSQMIFTKNHNYDITISGITAHMMSNYELRPVSLFITKLTSLG
jgi:hypothetical protein